MPDDSHNSAFVWKYLTMYSKQIITLHDLVNGVMDGFEQGYEIDQLPSILAALPKDALCKLNTYVDEAPHTEEEWAGTRSRWGLGYVEPMTYEESEKRLAEQQKQWYRFVIAFRKASETQQAR